MGFFNFFKRNELNHSKEDWLIIANSILDMVERKRKIVQNREYFDLDFDQFSSDYAYIMKLKAGGELKVIMQDWTKDLIQIFKSQELDYDEIEKVYKYLNGWTMEFKNLIQKSDV